MIFIQLLIVASVLSKNGGLHRRMISEAPVASPDISNQKLLSEAAEALNYDPTTMEEFQDSYSVTSPLSSKTVQSKQEASSFTNQFRSIYKTKGGLKYEAGQFQSIRSLPKKVETKSETVLLPFARADSKKLTLIVDLDETLVHCSVSSFYRNMSDLEISDGTRVFYCIFRPQYKKFLKRASEKYEVIVFSNASQTYSDRVLDALDPEKKFITGRLYRQHCKFINGFYIKDITDLGRPLSSVVALDNSYVSFAYNLDNLMPIQGFFNIPRDRELMYSLEAIKSIDSENVQDSLIKMFQLQTRIYEVEASVDAKASSSLASVFEDPRSHSLGNIQLGLELFKETFSTQMNGAHLISGQEAQAQYEENQFAFIRLLPETIPNRSDEIFLDFEKDPFKKLTLVVDMDETLVHCSHKPIALLRKHDFKFFLTDRQIYCLFRPEARQFLKAASEKYEVILFTAGSKSYADPILDALDPTHEFITHRLYRDHCSNVNGKHIKDISRLGRPLSNVIAVDNSFLAIAYNLDNLMPITNFYNDQNDRELMDTLRMIGGIDWSRDFRNTLNLMYRVQNRIFGG